ncbi:hypothetical protein [Flavobacterium sp.]|uniref:hypothetical protein n=1 Tax=Flavobacterium sp. TaxID=239 RepID=UPI0032635353
MNSTISFLFNKKVLVHRVNSIEKLNAVKNNFHGVELDLIYDKKENLFDINHPPAQSINLNLNDYLAHSKSLKNLIYWLDFKNIDSSNTNKSLYELNRIIAKLNIPRNHIIIESSFPELITNFKKAGYKTSYYLPPFLYSKSKDSLNYYIDQIELKTKNYPTDYISFDYLNFPIISNKFPHLKKISWYSDQKGIINKIYSKFLVYEVLLDKNVDFFLLPNVVKNTER